MNLASEANSEILVMVESLVIAKLLVFEESLVSRIDNFPRYCTVFYQSKVNFPWLDPFLLIKCKTLNGFFGTWISSCICISNSLTSLPLMSILSSLTILVIFLILAIELISLTLLISIHWWLCCWLILKRSMTVWITFIWICALTIVQIIVRFWIKCPSTNKWCIRRIQMNRSFRWIESLRGKENYCCKVY